MPAFSITPQGGWPAPTAETPPRFMQIQASGVDLGTPTVDTLNFGSGTTATRGTGENANTVTVTAEGGGGTSVPELVVQLTPNVGNQTNREFFNDWTANVIQESSAVTYAPATGLTFVQAGIYEVVITGKVEFTDSFGNFPGPTMQYGARVVGALMPVSQHSAKGDGEWSIASDEKFVQWTDRFLVTADAAQEFAVSVYSDVYLDQGFDVSTSATLTVRRLGDAPAA